MKQLIIIGAGGMGRTMYDWAKESIGYGVEFVIKGYIDGKLDALQGFENYPPMLGDVDDYQPQPDEVFVCAIGGRTRKACIEAIKAKGGKFINLIHHTVRMGTNVEMGEGNILGPYSAFGADSVIGSYNLIQNYVIVGHDVVIGDWNRLDTRVTCVGGIKIGNENVIHSSVVLSHNVVVENNAQVGACSLVIRRVKEGTSVFGIPAKRIDA